MYNNRKFIYLQFYNISNIDYMNGQYIIPYTSIYDLSYLNDCVSLPEALSIFTIENQYKIYITGGSQVYTGSLYNNSKSGQIIVNVSENIGNTIYIVSYDSCEEAIQLQFIQSYLFYKDQYVDITNKINKIFNENFLNYFPYIYYNYIFTHYNINKPLTLNVYVIYNTYDNNNNSIDQQYMLPSYSDIIKTIQVYVSIPNGLDPIPANYRINAKFNCQILLAKSYFYLPFLSKNLPLSYYKINEYFPSFKDKTYPLDILGRQVYILSFEYSNNQLILSDFNQIFTTINNIFTFGQYTENNPLSICVYYLSNTPIGVYGPVMSSLYINNDNNTNLANLIINTELPVGTKDIYFILEYPSKPNYCSIFKNKDYFNGLNAFINYPSGTFTNNKQILFPLPQYLSSINSIISGSSSYLGNFAYYPVYLYQQLEWLNKKTTYIKTYVTYSSQNKIYYATASIKLNKLVLYINFDQPQQETSYDYIYLNTIENYKDNLYIPLSGSLIIPANCKIEISQYIYNFNNSGYYLPGNYTLNMLTSSYGLNKEQCFTVKLNLVNYSKDPFTTLTIDNSFRGLLFVHKGLVYIKSSENIILGDVADGIISVILVITGNKSIILGPHSQCYINGCCN